VFEFVKCLEKIHLGRKNNDWSTDPQAVIGVVAKMFLNQSLLDQ
jgi:hypothetical protein